MVASGTVGMYNRMAIDMVFLEITVNRCFFIGGKRATNLSRVRFTHLCVLSTLLLSCIGYAEDGICLFDHEGDREHINRTIDQFMVKFKVPGLSIALSKDGELMLSKGYGYANREEHVPVTPSHRFRVASVAKPITSIAIMKLVEEGKLNLDDLVFGEQGILAYEFHTTDPYVITVTVRHLLEHSAGREWSNSKNDPMFMKTGLNHTELIQWVLDHRTLDRAPGSSYAYSNFGYCVLGRVIEKVAGVPYSAFVKGLLAEHGITSLAIATNEPAEMEVTYYAQQDRSPYSMPISRMDSHGGWIATAEDLVRMIQRVDGRESSADILTSSTITVMTRPSSNTPHYASGWSVNEHDNWWHMGSLPGTASVIVRAHQNMCWAVLVNTRSQDKAFLSDLDALTWKVIRGVQTGPSQVECAKTEDR
jgi:D-alanyl-D-alanine carboxypeptidase